MYQEAQLKQEQRPFLREIIGFLEVQLHRYESTNNEMTERLQTIKRVPSVSVKQPNENRASQVAPEDFFSEASVMFNRFVELNDQAERNLSHLKEII